MDILSDIRELLYDPEGPGMNISIKWVEWPDGYTIDKVTGAKIGTPKQCADVVRGLFHEVTASQVERQYAEVQAGDAIMEILPSDGHIPTVLDTLEDIEVIANGKTWVPKKVGSKLAGIWDANIGEVPGLKTYLVTLKT